MPYHWDNDDLILNVYIQPNASQNIIMEPEFNSKNTLGERIKIRIKAPPADGKANKMLLALLAKSFKVAKSDIEIIAGMSSRQKRLRIHSPRLLPCWINKCKKA